MASLFRLQVMVPRDTHKKLLLLADEASKLEGRRVFKNELVLRIIQEFLDSYNFEDTNGNEDR